MLQHTECLSTKERLKLIPAPVLSQTKNFLEMVRNIDNDLDHDAHCEGDSYEKIYRTDTIDHLHEHCHHQAFF